jgi:hypothetical protein
LRSSGPTSLPILPTRKLKNFLKPEIDMQNRSRKSSIANKEKWKRCKTNLRGMPYKKSYIRKNLSNLDSNNNKELWV